MKKLFSRIHFVMISVFAVIAQVMAPPPGSVTGFMPVGRLRKQGGFILLNKSYMGYAAGTIVELPQSTELAMIANGTAQLSAGPATAGPVSTSANSGSVTVAAGQSSLVITNPAITVQSLIYAMVSQAAADGTALRVDRVSVTTGSVTLFLNAAATAAVSVDWAILNPNGSFSAPI